MTYKKKLYLTLEAITCVQRRLLEMREYDAFDLMQSLYLAELGIEDSGFWKRGRN
jgi:hypothetical protein